MLNKFLMICCAGFMLTGCYGYGQMSKVNADGSAGEGVAEFYMQTNENLIVVYFKNSSYCEGDASGVNEMEDDIFLTCTNQPLSADTGAIQKVDYLMVGSALKNIENDMVYDLTLQVRRADGTFAGADRFKGYVVVDNEESDGRFDYIIEGLTSEKLLEGYNQVATAYPRGPLKP